MPASRPSGTGKTHCLEGLAHLAIEAGQRVAWFSLESLTASIGKVARMRRRSRIRSSRSTPARRPVRLVGHDRQASGGVGLVPQDAGLGIDVEADGGRGPRTAGPGARDERGRAHRPNRRRAASDSIS